MADVWKQTSTKDEFDRRNHHSPGNIAVQRELLGKFFQTATMEDKKPCMHKTRFSAVHVHFGFTAGDADPVLWWAVACCARTPE